MWPKPPVLPKAPEWQILAARGGNYKPGAPGTFGTREFFVTFRFVRDDVVRDYELRVDVPALFDKIVRNDCYAVLPFAVLHLNEGGAGGDEEMQRNSALLLTRLADVHPEIVGALLNVPTQGAHQHAHDRLKTYRDVRRTTNIADAEVAAELFRVLPHLRGMVQQDLVLQSAFGYATWEAFVLLRSVHFEVVKTKDAEDYSSGSAYAVVATRRGVSVKYPMYGGVIDLNEADAAMVLVSRLRKEPTWHGTRSDRSTGTLFNPGEVVCLVNSPF